MTAHALPVETRRRPRLGFLGLGWIGRMRFESMVREEALSTFAVADASREAAMAALAFCPGGTEMSFEAMLEDSSIDGIVIATPSGCHAEQTIAALRAGKAVFCQKPLGRNAGETRQVVGEARRADRILKTDMCYRAIDGVDWLRETIQSGELGALYAVEATFHNAYSPNAGWAFDPNLAGGGCLIDLGTHLLDLIFWTLGRGDAIVRAAELRREGRIWKGAGVEVEDYASALLTLPDGVLASMRCSWNLHGGQDACFAVKFYGTRGGVGLRNVRGSFYDFVVERFYGARTTLVAESSADWSGIPVVRWAERVADDRSFDPGIEHLIPVARALDAIYSSAGRSRGSQ